MIIESIKKFFCWMHWHSYFVGYDDIEYIKNDPLQFQRCAKCKWCNFKGMVDSQGNLF